MGFRLTACLSTVNKYLLFLSARESEWGRGLNGFAEGRGIARRVKRSAGPDADADADAEAFGNADANVAKDAKIAERKNARSGVLRAVSLRALQVFSPFANESKSIRIRAGAALQPAMPNP